MTRKEHYLNAGCVIAPTINFHWVSLSNISLGINVCFYPFNIELHLPFSFIRLGWVWKRDLGKILELSNSGCLWWC
jgi:hypothetical protein